MKLTTKKLLPGINKYLAKYPEADTKALMKQFNITRKEAQAILNSRSI